MCTDRTFSAAREASTQFDHTGVVEHMSLESCRNCPWSVDCVHLTCNGLPLARAVTLSVPHTSP